MNIQVSLTGAKLVDELPNHWSNEDYKRLLEDFEFEDSAEVADEDLREMLFLAIADREPDESARIVLNYKLGDNLSEGQIDQISHEMLLDKISEEYSDINYHHELFHINQLLFKAYNGKFPSARASIITFELKPAKKDAIKIDKAVVLKVLAKGISDRAVLKRLFEEQLESAEDFPEAEAILWELTKTGGDEYQLVTSEYWLDQNDFNTDTFEATLPNRES